MIKYMILFFGYVVLILVSCKIQNNYEIIERVNINNIRLLFSIIFLGLALLTAALMEKSYRKEKKRRGFRAEKCSRKNFEQNSNAIPVDLTTGTWICGEDIAQGRYTATSTVPEYSGHINIIFSETSRISERLGEEGVPSVTFTIITGDTIRISGMPSVHFEPVKKTL